MYVEADKGVRLQHSSSTPPAFWMRLRHNVANGFMGSSGET